MRMKIKYVTTTGTEHVRIRENGRKKRYKQWQKMEERRRDISRGKKRKKEEEI